MSRPSTDGFLRSAAVYGPVAIVAAVVALGCATREQYLRLRRDDYGPADLDAWAERIRTTRRWKRVYVYFKHEDGARGAELARDLGRRFAPRPPRAGSP